MIPFVCVAIQAFHFAKLSVKFSCHKGAKVERPAQRKQKGCRLLHEALI